jgi:predicted XRE-type DNA-binding protein
MAQGETMKRKIKSGANPDSTRTTPSSGNYWLDIGYTPDQAATESAKVWLTKRIHDRIKELGLTQIKAAKLLGISQPEVSKLINVLPTQFSLEKLMSFLRSLDLDTEIVIGPKRGKTADMRVTEAA